MRCAAPLLDPLAVVGRNRFDLNPARRRGLVSSDQRPMARNETPRQIAGVRPFRDITVCLLESVPTATQKGARAVTSASWKIRLFPDPLAFLSYMRPGRPEEASIAHGGSRMNGVNIGEPLGKVSPPASVLISLPPRQSAARSVLSGRDLISLSRESYIAHPNGFIQPDGGKT